MNDKQKNLINHAKNVLLERYLPPIHSTAAALRTTSGEIFTAVNIDHFSAYICAEAAALSSAIQQGIYEFTEVVAVRKINSGEVAVANMCGKCRQIFHDYAPEISVILREDSKEKNRVLSIEDLLPHAFTRQRDKIQAVMKGAETK